jgi:hypothetical protein
LASGLSVASSTVVGGIIFAAPCLNTDALLSGRRFASVRADLSVAGMLSMGSVMEVSVLWIQSSGPAFWGVSGLVALFAARSRPLTSRLDLSQIWGARWESSR